jgi:hypothetical protein
VTDENGEWVEIHITDSLSFRKGVDFLRERHTGT